MSPLAEESVFKSQRSNDLCFQLEEVMETETYKNAKIILERFDPEAKRKAVSLCISRLYQCVLLVHFEFYTFCFVNSLLIFPSCLPSCEGAGVHSSPSSDDSQARTRYDNPD